MALTVLFVPCSLDSVRAESPFCVNPSSATAYRQWISQRSRALMANVVRLTHQIQLNSLNPKPQLHEAIGAWV